MKYILMNAEILSKRKTVIIFQSQKAFTKYILIYMEIFSKTKLYFPKPKSSADPSLLKYSKLTFAF